MKKIFQIAGETAIPPGSSLLIRVGEKHFGFAITGPGQNALIQLAYYGELQLNAEELKQIVSSNSTFDHNFSKVVIGYDFDCSFLLPSHFYKPESSSQMLSLLYRKNGRTENLKDFIPSWQLYNLFEVPAEIHAFLIEKFQAAIFFHQHSVEILNYEAAAGESLTIDITTRTFSALAMKNGSLLLAQSYEYEEPADMIYYLLKICEQFGLSPKEVKIQLSGLIDENSALFEELSQYFMNVGFRAANWSSVSEYPAHFFSCFSDLLKYI